MAQSPNTRKQCSKCGSQKLVYPCDGCEVLFCSVHQFEHHEELKIQLDNIEEQCNYLRNIHDEHGKCQEHPLFSQIDVWEQDTIAKIKETAETARHDLEQLINESNNQMKNTIEQLKLQLQNKRQIEDFTEIDLNQWKEQLINIKKQLETPCDIELMSDKNSPPIHLIKVNSSTKNPPLSQQITLCEEQNTTEYSCDNELDKSQLTDTSECTLDSQEHEPSAIPKEEQSQILCERLTTECEIYLDPTQSNHFVLLQLSNTTQSKILEIYNQLTTHSIEIINQADDYLDKLRCTAQTTIFIDFFQTSLNEQRCLFDSIFQLANIYSVYIRGVLPENGNERNGFVREYPKIKAVFDHEERLMVQWVIDTVNEYKRTGDMYVKIDEKVKGGKCFQEGITLYKNLSEFLNKKRCIR